MSSSPQSEPSAEGSPNAHSDSSSPVDISGGELTESSYDSAHNATYRAVIFDMGGVLVKYKHPEMYKSLAKNSVMNAEFKQDLVAYETGAASLADIQHHMKSIPQLSHLCDLDGPGLFDQFMGDHDLLIEKAIDSLIPLGYKVALCTNNGFLDAEHTKSALVCDTSRFHAVVESCRVGIRKPSPGIYQITAERLGVPCDECVFIDDLAVNCVGAEEVGMKAIHVSLAQDQAQKSRLKLGSARLLVGRRR